MSFETNKHRRAADPLAGEPDGWIVADRLRVRDRIAARWRSRRIDLALAAGASPEAAASFALRAQRLTDLSHRRSLAGALRRVVRQADEGSPPSYARILPCRARVVAASAELSLLADNLADPGPVAVRGVAQALILLTDGAGPLYNPSSRESLLARVVSAAANLRPWTT